MNDYFILFISTAFVDNFVLVKFLGLCPFLGISKKIEVSLRMGMATSFVMTVSSICTWLINNFILLPFNISYLRTLTFIFIIAVVVQFTELLVYKTNQILYRMLGIFLPLITTNCTVLGVVLLNTNKNYNLLQSALNGFSAAIGFSIIMVLFAAMRERLVTADAPKPFQGSSIALITAGLMSLTFMGFNGLVRM